jgi:hypothetical protein
MEPAPLRCWTAYNTKKISEHFAISMLYNNALKLLSRHLVALRNHPLQVPEFELQLGFQQFFFYTTSFLTAGVELNTGVYPMKADAWAIAKTAKRRVRNLFIVVANVFHRLSNSLDG